MYAIRIALAAAVLLAPVLATAEAEAPATTPAAESPSQPPAEPAKKLTFTDDWQIVVNHDADSDGEILFRVTVKDGAAKDITVPIKKGTGENAIAREIKKVFAKDLGTKHYNIEMEDGEKVIIERDGGKGDTSIVVVSSTVKGVTIKVERD